MNTLLPNLNATPISPSAPSGRPSFQADPSPSDPSTFTQALAKEVADRSANDNNNQVKPNQNPQNTQNTQNTQSADADSAQNTQNSQDSTATPVDAKKDGKDADKAKADKEAAAASDADKTSSELLALVAASQADGKVTPQQQAAAMQALPVAAPLTAQIESNGGKGKGKHADDAIDADGKSTKTALSKELPDAWDAKAATGADGKTGPAISAKAGDPATAGKTAVKDAANGKTDAAIQAAADKTAAPASALAAKAGPDLQTLTAGQASNDNAMFNPALQQVASASAPSATAAAGDKLAPQVGTTDWDSALGQKMVWMSSNGQQSATLTLNPRDLGPMQVTINVNKTQADATFIAANPEVKAALEAAMPKLREMMDQAGIQLGQANVSTGMPNQNQQAFNQPRPNGSSHAGGRGNGGGRNDGDIAISSGGAAAPASGGSSGLGLVDTFV
ncbi:MAG TPA: flagellar hook-length control protein FliK [Herbaspirillum sp.]